MAEVFEKAKKMMVDRKEAARLYSVAAGTLANMLSQGRGPRAFKVGRKILYKMQDLEEFFTAHPIQTIDSITEN